MPFQWLLNVHFTHLFCACVRMRMLNFCQNKGTASQNQ